MDGHRSGKRFSRRFQRIARLVPRVLLVLSVLVMASRLGADAILTTDRRHFTVARLPDGSFPTLVP